MARYEVFKSVPEKLNIPFVPINSNVHSFLPDNISAAITFANAAAVNFVSRRIGVYYYASSGYDYETLGKLFAHSNGDRSCNMGDIEIFLVPMLSTTSQTMIPEDTGKPRIDKVATIAGYDITHDNLNVCNSVSTKEKNCSCCTKCRHTMAELELTSNLDKFAKSFDIKRYRTEFRARDFADIIHCRGKSQFYSIMNRYAKEKSIDLEKFTTSVDKLCAIMNGTCIYRFLKKTSLLKPLKALIRMKTAKRKSIDEQ